MRRVWLVSFVHPVIRRLPQDHHIRVEQGLLKTFGRVIPVLMTLSVILAVSYAISFSSVEGIARTVRWGSAARALALGGSIADVAALAGFVDQSHLTRHFKRITGTTPGQYAAGHFRPRR